MSYKAEIPYGAYWSTPFARWQGSFANLHSIEFAAHVAKAELAKRKIDPKASTTACSASRCRKSIPSTACPG
jgi:acetyl-CoA acetyltransferase